MASSSTTSPDCLISLKVNHDGVTKKLKLPLRDLGASTLEDKLRAALLISPSTDSVIERYSDSAAAYVVLDKTNVSVYKQLYRAAKAKQKLKLRVTTTPEEVEEPKKVPKPVTVEDVPDGSEIPEAKVVNQVVEKPATQPSPPAPKMDRPRPPPWQFAETDLRDQLKNMALNHVEFEKNITQLEASIAEISKKSPSPRSVPQARLPEMQHFPVAAKPSLQKMFVECSKPEPEVLARAAPTHRASFAVCCNSCDRTVPDAHYHCSTCDDGDFDLCQDCVDRGITCYGDNHWLIKRFVKNGIIINSTTERIAPKPKVQKPSPPPVSIPQFHAAHTSGFDFNQFIESSMNTHVNVRTCNNCVAELSESEFVHCTTCYDFDLCKTCFAKNEHGHHPKHGFIPAVEASTLDSKMSPLLAPGRNQKHNAICDGCDKYVRGIRHKCLDCPDWDYCSDCVVNAGFIHPNHRFVPVYEPISEVKAARCTARVIHVGICCDGPLCNTARSGSGSYVVGDRYKCAVCDNTDFCANCEASPANTHNKTHPLIKFKTPVRHVSVTTTGERDDGRQMPAMGDRARRSVASFHSRATETSSAQSISINDVQTVVDVKPTQPPPPPVNQQLALAEELQKLHIKEEVEQPAVRKAPSVDNLVAVYERDTVADGTVLPPNHVFEQTWVLRNAGTVPWPAGCSVKFVSGDYMGHVDHEHPAGIHELVSASESTICYEELQPGEEFPFTVLLRTPSRFGKAISYWRLSTTDGMKFGHRLWCDVDVNAPQPKVEPKVEIKEELKEVFVTEEASSSKDALAPSVEAKMIFPKLEKESPVASVYEAASVSTKVEEEIDDFDDCEDEEWDDDDSQDGFLTDEEYDILDASDEEYLEEQQKRLLKK